MINCPKMMLKLKFISSIWNWNIAQLAMFLKLIHYWVKTYWHITKHSITFLKQHITMNSLNNQHLSSFNLLMSKTRNLKIISFLFRMLNKDSKTKIMKWILCKRYYSSKCVLMHGKDMQQLNFNRNNKRLSKKMNHTFKVIWVFHNKLKYSNNNPLI